MFFSQSELHLQLLGIFKITRGKSIHDSFDRRSYDVIALRLSGNSSFQCDGVTIHVKPGQLLYIPSNVHYRSVTEGETIVCVHFNNPDRHGKSSIEVLTPEDGSSVTELLVSMYQEWARKEQGYFLLCTSLFYRLVYLANLQLQNEYVRSVDPYSKIRNAVDYIHSNYRREQITIAELADLSSVSETYFRKIFTRVYGVSPRRYINSLKLEYAAQLLQSNLYTVTEAGEKAGFSDSKYFSKLFKSHFGQAPGRFIKSPYEKTIR